MSEAVSAAQEKQTSLVAKLDMLETGTRERPFKIQKTWRYWTDKAGRNFFLAFVNAKGNCSIRIFDRNGYFQGREYRDGDYQDAFREYQKESLGLHLSRQPNLERGCRVSLPDWVLAEFRSQVPEPAPANAAD